MGTKWINTTEGRTVRSERRVLLLKIALADAIEKAEKSEGMKAEGKLLTEEVLEALVGMSKSIASGMTCRKLRIPR